MSKHRTGRGHGECPRYSQVPIGCRPTARVDHRVQALPLRKVVSPFNRFVPFVNSSGHAAAEVQCITNGTNVRLRTAPQITASIASELPLGTELSGTDDGREGWVLVEQTLGRVKDRERQGRLAVRSCVPGNVSTI
jgi:hypothetical protein